MPKANLKIDEPNEFKKACEIEEIRIDSIEPTVSTNVATIVYKRPSELFKLGETYAELKSEMYKRMCKEITEQAQAAEELLKVEQEPEPDPKLELETEPEKKISNSEIIPRSKAPLKKGITNTDSKTEPKRKTTKKK